MPRFPQAHRFVVELHVEHLLPFRAGLGCQTRAFRQFDSEPRWLLSPSAFLRTSSVYCALTAQWGCLENSGGVNDVSQALRISILQGNAG